MRYVISSKMYLSRTDEKLERAEPEVKSKLENMRKDKQKKRRVYRKNEDDVSILRRPTALE